MSLLGHAEKKKDAPDVLRGLLIRPRLRAHLNSVRVTRLSTIQAPAGYGKTSLLMQWRDALRTVGAAAPLIALEPRHRKPMDLLDHLAAAIEVETGLSLSALRVTIASVARPPSALLSAQLAEACAASSAPLFLLLDDAHVLNGTAGAIHCLESLIEHAPSELHVVLSSREVLELPLARWRARGELTEVAADALRFTDGEIGDLFRDLSGDDLDAEDIRALAERSEGWAAGLRLTARTISSRRDRADAVRSLSGERNDIWDYFTDEVLAAQPTAVRKFLLNISVLEKFCAPLCNEVASIDNGHEMIERCVKSGLFLVAIDNTRTWYRFHRLFREYLERANVERRDANMPALHGRACAWFSKNDMFPEAFEHALKAGDPMRAAALLDERLDALFGAGRAYLVPGLAARIPAHIQAFFPRLMLAAAWSLSMHWRFAEAKNLLTASKARIAELERLGTTSVAELATMKLILAHREMMLAQFQDDMPTVERYGVLLMRSYGEAHPFVLGSIYSAFLNSQREQFKLNDVDRLDATVTRYLDRCEGRQVHVAHEAVAGITRFLMGDTEAAIARLRNGLAITTRVFGEGVPLGAKTALPLAEVLYERNALAEASALVEKYLPLADELGFVDQLVSGWLTHARLLRMRGDLNGASRALASASALAAEHGFERLSLFAAEERVRQLLRSGRPEEAVRAARRAGADVARESVMPSGTVTSSREGLALIWASLAEAKNNAADALQVARQWLSFVRGAGAVRSAIRWEIRIAHLLMLSGQLRGAKRTLRRAISSAAPGRYLRSFLDEPALLRVVLTNPSSDSASGDAAEAFAAELSERFEQEYGTKPLAAMSSGPIRRGTGGTLSAHELEILKMAASGLGNREVGERLGMTEGSVKWHLQQIYAKIGVRRRILAIERARLMGLIN